MSLSGTLGFVPIDEVLRLLTRSGQESSVEVSGRGLFGRIFVGKRGVDLATTVKDAEVHRQLVNSGSVAESTLRRITTGETTLAAVAGDNQAAIDLVREMTIESIYRISQGGEEFQVREGVTSPYASPRSFDLDDILREADARAREWEKIFEVIPDLRDTITFNRDLADRDEVTVKADDWKVLSAIGSGSSVVEIGDNLGTSEFWAASITARLVKYDLLVVADETPVMAPPQAVDEYTWASSEIPPVSGETDQAEEPEEFETPEEVETPEDMMPVASEEDLEAVDVDPNESWWQEPAADEAAKAGSDVEEDTEAFLEKVFSEVSSEPSEEDGHGLMRRRRMGSILRELGEE